MEPIQGPCLGGANLLLDQGTQRHPGDVDLALVEHGPTVGGLLAKMLAKIVIS